MYSLIEPGDGKGFGNVKYPEKDKAQNPGCRMGRCQDEGDEHAQNLIDDNGARIRLIHELFSCSCHQKTDDESGQQDDKVGQQWQIFNEKPWHKCGQ